MTRQPGEALSLFAGITGSLVEGDRQAVAGVLRTMEAAELRTIVLAGAVLVGDMLEAEACESDAGLNAPAAQAFRLASIASRVL